MGVFLSLLDANLTLQAHAARALEKAIDRQRFLGQQKHVPDEEAFFQAYNALRDVEARELRLLHETALLAQLLKREEAAREAEQKLDQTFRAQETGNGKKAAIIGAASLQKQESAVAKDHRLVYRHVEELVNIFLAHHEALVRADRLFKALDPRLALLHPGADGVMLKLFARAEDSAQHLRELAVREVEQGQPRALAAALRAPRSKMRQRLTRLSDARRHFAAFLSQRVPMVGAL
jgi:hypothetical protein